MSDARAGAHSGLAVYAASKTTPDSASQDSAGAWVTGLPWKGSADGTSWSAMMIRMSGRRPAGIRLTAGEVGRRLTGTGFGGGHFQRGGVGEQLARVGLLGVGQHVRGVAELDDVALAQHGDALRDGPHQRQVVGDEEHREPEVALEAAEQLHDRGLDADVQRRGHLVADQYEGVADQGPGDRHPLPLPAGELIGVAAGVRRGQRYPLEHLPDPAVGLPAARGAEDPERLPDDLADRLPGVQRAVRILEDVLDPPPRVAAALARGGGQFGAAQRDATGPAAVQAGDRPGDRRLARARLTDQRQALVGGQAQAHRVDDLLPPVQGNQVLQAQRRLLALIRRRHFDRVADPALLPGDDEFGPDAADRVVRPYRQQRRHGRLALVDAQG